MLTWTVCCCDWDDVEAITQPMRAAQHDARSIEEEEEEEEGETRMRGRRSISRMGNGHLHDIGRVTPSR